MASRIDRLYQENVFDLNLFNLHHNNNVIPHETAQITAAKAKLESETTKDNVMQAKEKFDSLLAADTLLSTIERISYDSMFRGMKMCVDAFIDKHPNQPYSLLVTPDNFLFVLMFMHHIKISNLALPAFLLKPNEEWYAELKVSKERLKREPAYTHMLWVHVTGIMYDTSAYSKLIEQSKSPAAGRNDDTVIHVIAPYASVAVVESLKTRLTTVGGNEVHSLIHKLQKQGSRMLKPLIQRLPDKELTSKQERMNESTTKKNHQVVLEEVNRYFFRWKKNPAKTDLESAKQKFRNLDLDNFFVTYFEFGNDPISNSENMPYHFLMRMSSFETEGCSKLMASVITSFYEYAINNSVIAVRS